MNETSGATPQDIAQSSTPERARRARKPASRRPQAENPPPEIPQAPENINKETHKRELEIVAKAGIRNEAQELKKTDSENPENDAILTYLAFDEISDGKPIELGTDPLVVSGERIVRLTRNGDMFTAIIENQEDSPKEIPASEILNSQLLVEKDKILSRFQNGSSEKKAIELYIKNLVEGDEALNNISEVNETIINAAEKSGIVTTAKVQELVNWRRDAIKDNHDIETQTQLDWLKGIEIAMVGKTILDQKAMKAILLSPDLEKEIGDVSKSIHNLEKYLEKYPDIPKDGPDRKELQDLMDLRDALTKSKEKLHTDDPSTLQGSEIEKILSGTADAETMVKFERNLKEAITKGEPTALLEQLCPKDETWEEVLKGIKDEKKRKNLMLLLMVFGTFLFDGGKNLMPSLDGEQR